MNIVDSIGVMLGGDSSPFIKMMDEAEKRLDVFDKKMSNWSSKMTMYVSAPMLAMGTRNVFLFAEQEKAIMGLQAQLGKLSVKPFVEFSNELQDSLGKDNDDMVKLMARFAQMGVAAGKLKSTTTSAIGFGAATGMNDFMSFRALQMFKQGSTMMMSRYVPGLRGMDRQEQEAKVVELINRGLVKTRAELMGVAGSFRSWKLAMDDTAKSNGEMIAKFLKLPEIFRRLTGLVKDFEANMKSLSPETQKWAVWLGAALAAVGPITFALTKTLNILRAIVGTVLTVGKTLLTTVLPIVALIGMAFMGWEIGKALGGIQAGLLTINQWTELVITSMTERWEKYFSFIRTGMEAGKTEEALASAYGMAPNKLKVAAVSTGIGAAAYQLGIMSVFDNIGMTLTDHQSVLKMQTGELDNAKRIYGPDSGQVIAARVAVTETLKEMRQLFPGVKDVTAPVSPQIAALESAFKASRGDMLGFDKPGGMADSIGKKFQDIYDSQTARFEKEGKGTTTFQGFLDNLNRGIGADLLKGLEMITGPLGGFADKWFKEFLPPNLTMEKPDVSLERNDTKGRSFAAALEYGTKEAFSAIYGNNSVDDKLLDATERSADANEDIRTLLQEQAVSFNSSGLFNSVPSAFA